MRTFLDQPGVPLITARLLCTPGQPSAPGAPIRVELAQQRALPAGVADPAPRPWSVPVCLRYGDRRAGFRDCVALATTSAVFELGTGGHEGGAATGSTTGTSSTSSTSGRAADPARCPSWLLLNADALGYYRSAVDPATTRALLTPGSPIARAARPTPAERMMLIEDLRAAVARGDLPLHPLLAMIPVIAEDPDPKVALGALDAADLPLAGLPDALHAAARRWQHRVFGPRAARLGWQRGPRDSDELHELRQSVVPAVADDDPALTAEATRLADRWLADRASASDRASAGTGPATTAAASATGDLTWLALGVAARHGDSARFDRYLAAARGARDRLEQQRLLAALAGFDDPPLASRALAIALGREFDLRDALGIITQLLARRATRDLAAGFVAAHLDALLARLRDDEAAAFLADLAAAFCDADRRTQIAALVAPRAAQIGGAEAAVARALEQTDRCIARVQHLLPSLHHVLDRQ